MKKLANLVGPIFLGFAVVTALHFAVPGSLAFLAEDDRHIFDNSRHITVEMPAGKTARSNETSQEAENALAAL